jgi:iron-sulfur cluster assembly protein
VTERAAARIQDLLANHGHSNPEKDEPLGIRLGVRRRGCNGLSYTLNYAYDTAPTKDIAMESHGVKLWIEPMALFSIVGTTMDWEETELSSEFTFHNPNAKGSCGCGESFSV